VIVTICAIATAKEQHGGDARMMSVSQSSRSDAAFQ
jgi:hypothetical protein